MRHDMRKPAFRVTTRAVRPQKIDKGIECRFYADEAMKVVLHVLFYVSPNVIRRDLDLRYRPSTDSRRCFNPNKPNGRSHYYQMDKSTFTLWGTRSDRLHRTVVRASAV